MWAYFTAPLFTILFLGFASGLPLALTGATLSARLAEAKVDIQTIGLFASVATPYTLKFLWSPIMDALPFPLFSRLFGRRRGWILATQIGLMAALALLGAARPEQNACLTAAVAMLVAFLSASQDIVIDAYRVEILSPQEQGKGAAMVQLGYRIGMIASSAGALYLATYLGWQATYYIMAGIMLVGVAAVLLAREPDSLLEGAEQFIVGCALPPVSLRETSHAVPSATPPPRAHASVLQPAICNLQLSLRESVIHPFTDFMKHHYWWLILIFILVYKLADAFIGIVTNPFLLGIGFTKTDIANIVKIYGTVATLIGIFAGGALVARYGAVRILFVAGFLHAMTNLMYVLQVQVGADSIVLAASVALENISGGISSAAFVAFLSGLCNRHYTATQYALLSSLAAFGRTWLATPAGYVAKYLGWGGFFAFSALLALPGLAVLWWLNRRINGNDIGDLNQEPEENLQGRQGERA